MLTAQAVAAAPAHPSRTGSSSSCSRHRRAGHAPAGGACTGRGRALIPLALPGLLALLRARVLGAIEHRTFQNSRLLQPKHNDEPPAGSTPPGCLRPHPEGFWRRSLTLRSSSQHQRYGFDIKRCIQCSFLLAHT